MISYNLIVILIGYIFFSKWYLHNVIILIDLI